MSILEWQCSNYWIKSFSKERKLGHLVSTCRYWIIFPISNNSIIKINLDLHTLRFGEFACKHCCDFLCSPPTYYTLVLVLCVGLHRYLLTTTPSLSLTNLTNVFQRKIIKYFGNSRIILYSGYIILRILFNPFQL